ncbi:hypothetical protein B566_EDAN013509 [Ephemera danica]|nr:hypothetical protein B566_EDAN013509 [Ephemera danica]
MLIFKEQDAEIEQLSSDLYLPDVLRVTLSKGSLLGPVLFNLYINDIPSTENPEHAVYADDIATETSSLCADQAVTTLQTHAYLIYSSC